MQQPIKALRAAIPHTLPILTGFLFLGAAYGILLSSKGYGILWALFTSTIIFAGSMQFVLVELLVAGFNPLGAFFMTLMVNARHLFYGIATLGKFKGMGAKKPYLIFAMCDETFSLYCGVTPPEDVDEGWFYTAIAFLDHFYWVMGSVLGSVAGSFITFDTTGIDFAMTALFVVIFTEQWISVPDRRPAAVGLAVTAVVLIVVGNVGAFIPLSMAGILLVLTLMRTRIEGRPAA